MGGLFYFGGAQKPGLLYSSLDIKSSVFNSAVFIFTIHSLKIRKDRFIFVFAKVNHLISNAHPPHNQTSSTLLFEVSQLSASR